MKIKEERIKEEVAEMLNITDRVVDWYDVIILLNKIEKQESEIHKLFNQCTDLIEGIYEHVDESSELFDLAERFDKE